MKKRARSGTAQRGKRTGKVADGVKKKTKAPQVLARFERADHEVAVAVKSMDAATEAAVEASRLSRPFDRAVAQLRTDDGKVRYLVPAVDPIRDLARELRRQSLRRGTTKPMKKPVGSEVARSILFSGKHRSKDTDNAYKKATSTNPGLTPGEFAAEVTKDIPDRIERDKKRDMIRKRISRAVKSKERKR